MEEQTQGLNVETVSAEGTHEVDSDFENAFLQAFGAGTGDAPTTGGDASGAAEADGGETQALTTGEAETAENSPQDGEEAGADAEIPAEPEEPPKAAKRELRLKVNHEDRTVDINAMSDEELTVLLQKGHAFDGLKAAQKEARDAEAYRKKVQQFVSDEGYSADAARGMAAALLGTKAYPVEISEDGAVTLSSDNNFAYPDFAEIESAPKPSQPAAPTPDAPKAPPDLASELRKLRKAFPALTEIPQDVEALHNDGFSYVEAMLLHNANRAQTKAAETMKENKQLRQQAEAASRAPVRGVSGGGTPPKPNGGLSENESAFLAGFSGKSPIRHA